MEIKPEIHLAISWADNGLIKSSFAASVIKFINNDFVNEKIICETIVNTSSALSEGRNGLVRAFLKTHCEWLLMMDADTIWTIQNVYDLCSIAISNNIKILSGIYMINMHDGEGWKPGVWNIENGNNIPIDISDKFDIDLFPISYAGAGAMLVHREVFERTEKISPDGLSYWFMENYGGNYCGEDFYFYLESITAGYQPYATTKVMIPHLKEIPITYEHLGK